MSTATVGENPIDVLKTHSPEYKAFQNMDAMQARVDPYLPTDEKPVLQSLPNVPIELQREAFEITDQLCEKLGQKSLSRRMVELNERISAVVEKHIYMKKDKEHEKKTKAQSQTGELQSWKNWQGWTHAGSGFGSIFLAIAGPIIGGGVGEAFKTIIQMQLSSSAAQSLISWMNGKETPLQFEQSFFLNSVSMEKQTIEGLKRMPDEVRQLVMELMRKELQAFEAIANQR